MSILQMSGHYNRLHIYFRFFIIVDTHAFLIRMIVGIRLYFSVNSSDLVCFVNARDSLFIMSIHLSRIRFRTCR